ncbi:type VI secretion system ImpA family N-terminal domain-containing protein [Kalamiella sp. sgz302252]|uniref:type VI secretion system ImpA family N-terminal domain-containing protein n=1 Tax=Pantoea sp. sgz302252 TaxID=3341827 RepID=UPI0036D41592
MTTPGDNILHTGGDPRALAEFGALRQEIAMMAGEAGPNWPRVEILAIALFRANGMDLQSVAWYSLARAHNAGLPGLCEGFEIVTAMVKHQWPTLWPQQLSARLAILTWLSTGMQQWLNEARPQAEELELLYRLQAQLEQNVKTLETLAQKHLSQLDRLAIQLEQLIAQLGEPQSQPPASQSTLSIAAMARCASRSGDEFTPLIYVPRDLTSSTALNVSFGFWERSRGFFAGMLVALLLYSLGFWAFQLAQPEISGAQRIALLAQQLSPELTRQDQEWQKAIAAVALPTEQLALWHTARLRLQKLFTQIAKPVEQRTGCLSYAEVEAQLVTIRQPLEAMQPVEELLRQLESDKTSPVLRGKTEYRLKQLLARYALILQAEEGSTGKPRK